MSFGEAVSAVFSKYAVFSGRARRSEFWWFALFNFLVSAILGIIDHAVIGHDVLASIFSLAVLLPTIGVSARRLHDVGRSGWWLLIGVIPVIGAIILIIWYAKEGTPGSNEYGAPV